METAMRTVNPLIEDVNLILTAMDCLGYDIQKIVTNGEGRFPNMYITYNTHGEELTNALITKTYYDLMDMRLAGVSYAG